MWTDFLILLMKKLELWEIKWPLRLYDYCLALLEHDNHNSSFLCIRLPLCIIRYSFFFFLFRAAYGSSQRGQIVAAAAGLCHSHTRSEAASVTYIAGCSNAGSLTHWEKPGIEPTSLWILVVFLTCWATMGTPSQVFIIIVS